uniref:Uncharacterized protein n=1 Tax=Romanomermis culicivorax TaxID=13658 RepID=A0A915JNH4_ROMCU
MQTIYNDRQNFNEKGDGYEDNTKYGDGSMTGATKIWNETMTIWDGDLGTGSTVAGGSNDAAYVIL